MDKPLSQLVKKPSIYFLYTFEAPILRNDSQFSTVYSQFITVRTHLPIPIKNCYYFQTSWESPAIPITVPKMLSCQTHDVLWRLNKKGEVTQTREGKKNASLVLIQLNEIQLAVFGVVPKMKTWVLHSQNENGYSLLPSLRVIIILDGGSWKTIILYTLNR